MAASPPRAAKAVGSPVRKRAGRCSGCGRRRKPSSSGRHRARRRSGLLARTEPPPRRQPMRVVLDSKLRLRPQGKLFASLAQAPVIVIGAADADPAGRIALESAGARVAQVAGRAGAVDVGAALAWLAGDGVERMLCEGGGQLAASLIAAGCVDRLEWMRAPIVLGSEGRPAVAALALQRLSEAPAWRRVAVRELGPDLWESYERAP
ncbi:MAG: RibD family protein [Hyphomonadaceae bacterium]